MKKNVILVIILTFIAKIFGFGRDIALSYYYGTSFVSDAYLITIIIGVSIFGIIAKAVTSSFIPLYKSVESLGDKNKTNLFLNNVINSMGVLMIVLVIFTIVFAEQIVSIFASNFGEEEFILAVRFTRISILGLALVILINIFNGYLQIKGNHKLPALISLPLNIVIVITIFLSSKFSLYLLPIGLVLGSLLQFILVYLVSYKYGYRFKNKLDLNDQSMREMIKNSKSIFIGGSTQQINTIIDRALASTVVAGGVSAISYANSLNVFVQSIFVLSITAVMYPELSKNAVEKDKVKFNHTLKYSLSSMALVIIPTSIFILFFAEEIITLMFGRGNFTSESIELTTGPLIFYSLGMIAFAYRSVLNKAFYAYSITHIPMINSIIGVSINIVLNFILSYFIGLKGLALATSISASITTILLFTSYKKRNENLDIKYIYIIFMKASLSSIIMIAISTILYPLLYLHLNQWIAMILIIGIGGTVYSILLIIFKVNELKDLMNTFVKKLSVRK